MSKVDHQIMAEAAEWIVLLDDPSATAQTRHDFAVWVKQDPAHEKALQQVRSVWGDLDHVLQSDEIADTTVDQVVPWYSVAGVKETLSALLPARVPVVTGWRQGIAAAVFMGIAVGIAYTQFTPLTPEKVMYETAIGGVDTITLEDDSIVFLNTGSRITVNFSKEERLVILEQGEAHFDVKSDAQRPFNVQVGEQLVQAIGTAFSVRYDRSSDKENVSVVVSEGRVLVRPTTIPGVNTPSVADTLQSQTSPEVGQEGTSLLTPSRAILKAGDRAQVSQAKGLEVIEMPIAEIERKLSWRHGGLIFDRERLEDVIGVMGEYTPTKIVITDPGLRNLEVGGYFKLGDIDSMLDVLEVGFGVTVVRVNDDLIEIRQSS